MTDNKAAQRRYRAKPDYPAKQRNSFLKRKYGISLQEWEEKFDKQGRRCAICFVDKPQLKWWATDHDHRTGQLRSILCNNCNNLLGFSKDNPETLLEAFHYLCKHSGNTEFFLTTRPYLNSKTEVGNQI